MDNWNIGNLVKDSVRCSVWYLAGNSVSDSVWVSVKASVWNSVEDSVNFFMGGQQ